MYNIMNLSDLPARLYSFFQRLPSHLRFCFLCQSQPDREDTIDLDSVPAKLNNDKENPMQEQSGEHTGWNAYFTYQHPPPLTTQHEDMAAFFIHPGERHTELDSVCLSAHSRPSSMGTIKGPYTSTYITSTPAGRDRRSASSSIMTLPKRDSFQLWVDENNIIRVLEPKAAITLLCLASFAHGSVNRA